ncbi:hypothetical protein ALC60_12651 [Trachymyrmex zeteki]|uniref:Uncharacterized protein n=1 Tax=Mycetomoellerius zeteki TaxID=64791 RepID=A0A151WKC0_9HYME|nr:hypothetical protein ALC60_12651 [Trachymyrmex zeteki]
MYSYASFPRTKTKCCENCIAKLLLQDAYVLLLWHQVVQQVYVHSCTLFISQRVTPDTPKSVAIRERSRLRASQRPWRGLEAFVSESVAEFVFRSAISPSRVVKAKLKKLRRGKRKPRVENLKTNRAPECGAVCKRI